MVGKIDCTKYTSVATHFGVRGFPTIMYIDAQRKVEFVGDRNKDEMFEFVKRLSSPSIRELKSCDDLEKVKRLHNVFFISFSNQPTQNYSESAIAFQATDWFFHLNVQCTNFEFNSIYCIKTSLRNNVISKRYDQTKLLLNDWIRLERYPKFMRIGLSNIHYLLNSNKIIAIALINESKVGRFKTKKEREYYEILEQLANSYKQNDQFIFGWTNQLDMINSIVIQTIEPIPNFVFINSTTMNYYLYDGENEKQLESQLIQILDSLLSDQPILSVHGGNSYLNRFKRIGYDGFIAVSLMFESNPILTVILFGLPITFFSIIIYCSCCSDILDGKDDFHELSEEDEDADEEDGEYLNEEANEKANEQVNEEIEEYEGYESKEDNKTDHLKSD